VTKKTRYLGNESGKSSKRWFTPSARPHPYTGDGRSNASGPLLAALKLIFRTPDGKKIKESPK